MFKISIKTGGAAFRDVFTGNENNADEAVEVSRLLSDVSAKVAAGYRSGVIMDINGNKVGEFSFD